MRWKDKTKIERLLEDNNEAYYWMGFLVADGHFNEHSIALHLSNKDLDHINKFKKFIGYVDCLGKNCIHIGSKKYVSMIRKKFDISSNKTTTPSNIKDIPKGDLLLSFIVGFIDGDGSVVYQAHRKDCTLRIKCHSSWEFNLDYMLSYIYEICGTDKNIKASVRAHGYAEFGISNSIVLKKLKNKVILLDIPYLSRKWDRINTDFVSIQENGKIRKAKTIDLLSRGYRQIDIAKELGVTKSAISLIISRSKEKQSA